MIKNLETVVLAQNSLLTTTDLNLVQAENLVSFTAMNCNFAPNFNIENVRIGNCQKLTTLNLSGTVGILLNRISNTLFALPKDWAFCTKLTTINFQNCGFNSIDVENIIIALAELHKLGMSSSIVTTKTITLNGQNGRPDTTKQSFIDAKNYLLSKTFTVLHN